MRRLREERGLSQRAAAKMAGKTHSRLRELEAGVDAHTGRAVTPTSEVIRKLARAYGVPPDPLLRMCGYGPEPGLPADEQRLLAAYRALPEPDRAATLADLEARRGPG